MKIAIVGAGNVGRTLGAALKAKGHTIIYGVREPGRSDERNAKSVREAVRGAEAVILATPWTATEALVCEHATDLAGKIVIDATNPLNPAMTGLALGFLTSGAELLQSQAQKAKFFKAFNSTGFGVMARPDFAEGKAAMFVAGPAGPDKKTVLRLVSRCRLRGGRCGRAQGRAAARASRHAVDAACARQRRLRLRHGAPAGRQGPRHHAAHHCRRGGRIELLTPGDAGISSSRGAKGERRERGAREDRAQGSNDRSPGAQNFHSSDRARQRFKSFSCEVFRCIWLERFSSQCARVAIGTMPP